MWIYILLLLLFVLIVGLYWIIQPYLVWRKSSNHKNQHITINYKGSQKKCLQQHKKHINKIFDLSLVVPSYNQQERLPIMLKETFQYLKTQKFIYEIIIVNDGSKDNTTNAALKTAQELSISNLYVIQYPKNRGKGGAVKAGMAVAQGQYILMVDADGATTFSELGAMHQKMLQIKSQCKHPLVMLAGSRAMFTDQKQVERKIHRKLISAVFGFIKTIVCGVKTKDTQCGFKYFTRQSAKQLFQILHIQRWAFDIQLFVICNALNYKTGQVPVEWRDVDGSKLNVIEASINMFRDVLMIRILYLFGIWKITDKVYIE